jgi:hypothetical protein
VWEDRQLQRRPILSQKDAKGWGHSGLAGGLLGRELDTFFEDVEGDAYLLLVDDERVAEADGGLAAAEDQEAAFEG